MALFKQIAGLKPKKHYFNLSFDNKFTCDLGQLIPVCCEEVIPGDRIKVNIESVIRLQPMVAPILQTVDVRLEAFFVPNRILDDNWEDFITGGKDGNNNYSLPLQDYFYSRSETPAKYSLWDYFGLPLVESDVTSDPDKESLPIKYPFMAYNLIYNEYYRDENVMNEVSENNVNVLNRCWAKDYFTSALPFQQRGTAPAFHWSFEDIFDNAHVEFKGDYIPVLNVPDGTNWNKYTRSDTKYKFADLGTNSIYGTSYGFSQGATNIGSTPNDSGFTGDWSSMYHIDDDGTVYPQSFTVGTYSSDRGYSNITKSIYSPKGVPVTNSATPFIYGYSKLDGSSGVFGQRANYLNDNSIVGGASIDFGFNISELRENFQLQKYLERNMRSGYRYNEQLWARFGVRNGDSRMQRPEFLGSSRSTIMISEIPQTSASEFSSDPDVEDKTPQGNLAGKGLGAMAARKLVNFFVPEHGYIVINFSLVPKTSYVSQGINKKWLKRTKFDYYTPEFAHLSESQVLRRELYYTGDPASDLQVFGYQGIYDEYRHNRGIITSDFRDTFSYWHMGRSFSNAPVLNGDFLTIDPNSSYLKAPFAVQNERNFLVDCCNVIHALRPMPAVAEPGLVDHF